MAAGVRTTQPSGVRPATCFAVHGMNRGEYFLACRFPALSLRFAHWTLPESVEDPKSDDASESVLGGPFNSTVLPSGSFR